MSSRVLATQTSLARRTELSAPLRAEIARLVATALAEDVGSGDATTVSVLPHSVTCTAAIVARAPGVVAGLGVAAAVFEAVDETTAITQLIDDGTQVTAATALLRLEGSAAAILTGERTALNFLGHLSGIATLTRAYVDATRDTGATILDTRKTTPGMRHSEKYAVHCGGGVNHRLGLYDAVLIKDNHLLLSGTLEAAVAQARAKTELEITVEVETLDELARALEVGADRILLDNMSPSLMRKAVEETNGRVPLEASGGVSLATVAEIARTGVDFISVGALTHSAPVLDVSLEVTA